MRENLIELISYVQYLGGLEEKVADHLIANDVVPVVRCKDCRHRHGITCYHTTQKYLVVGNDHFCSYGERREGE